MREELYRVLIGLGGELSSGIFFSGKEAGYLWRNSYQLDSYPISLMLEYNPDQYDFEVALGGRKPDSPISAAVKWDATPGLSLTLSHQHNQEWGIAINCRTGYKVVAAQASKTLYFNQV